MTASVIVTWRFCASSERVRARGHRESIRHDDVVMANMPLKRSRREIGISYGRIGGATLRSSISDLHRPRPGTGRAGGTQPGAAHGGGQPVSPQAVQHGGPDSQACDRDCRHVPERRGDPIATAENVAGATLQILPRQPLVAIWLAEAGLAQRMGGPGSAPAGSATEPLSFARRASDPAPEAFVAK
jgi:hypothetical protein